MNGELHMEKAKFRSGTYIGYDKDYAVYYDLKKREVYKINKNTELSHNKKIHRLLNVAFITGIAAVLFYAYGEKVLYYSASTKLTMFLYFITLNILMVASFPGTLRPKKEDKRNCDEESFIRAYSRMQYRIFLKNGRIYWSTYIKLVIFCIVGLILICAAFWNCYLQIIVASGPIIQNGFTLRNIPLNSLESIFLSGVLCAAWLGFVLKLEPIRWVYIVSLYEQGKINFERYQEG